MFEEEDEIEESIASELNESIEDDENSEILEVKNKQQQKQQGGGGGGNKRKENEEEEEDYYENTQYTYDDFTTESLPYPLNQSISSYKSRTSLKLKTKSSDEDYSTSFEEDNSDIHDAYSGDFENEFSFSMSKNKIESPIKKGPVQIKVEPSTIIPSSSRSPTTTRTRTTTMIPSNQILPSVEIQTLEAELSLQKLSKEIIHLRNQQRESLKKRRLEVMEKKKRAQERREVYNREMNELQLELKQLKEINEKNQQILVLNEQKIKLLEYENTNLKETNEKINQMIEKQQNEINENKLAYKILQDEKEDIITKNEIELNKWKEEKEFMRKEITSSNLQIEILIKSNEKNEQRIIVERETLPQHYQTILNERLTYIKYLEDSLLKREESLKVEQERNNFVLNTMRNEIRSEWEKREVSLRVELEKEREVMVNEKVFQDSEINKLQFRLSSEKSELETLKFELQRKEKYLIEKEKQIERDFIELKMNRDGLEPLMRVYDYEKEKVKELREDEERKEKELKFRIKELDRRERDLERRERELEKILYVELEEEKDILREKEREILEYRIAIERNKELLEKEKDKVFRCGLELRKHYTVIQKGFRYWKQLMKTQSNTKYHLNDIDDDNIKLFEKDGINWSDILDDIRDEINLFDMGDDYNQSEEFENITSIKNNHKDKKYHRNNKIQKKISQKVDSQKYISYSDDSGNFIDIDGDNFIENGDQLIKYDQQQQQQQQEQEQEDVDQEDRIHTTLIKKTNNDHQLKIKRNEIENNLTPRDYIISNNNNNNNNNNNIDDSLEYSMISTSTMNRYDSKIQDIPNNSNNYGNKRDNSHINSNRLGSEYQSKSYSEGRHRIPLPPPPLSIPIPVSSSSSSSSPIYFPQERKKVDGKENNVGSIYDGIDPLVDIHITTENMKTIAMKYHIM